MPKNVFPISCWCSKQYTLLTWLDILMQLCFNLSTFKGFRTKAIQFNYWRNISNTFHFRTTFLKSTKSHLPILKSSSSLPRSKSHFHSSRKRGNSTPEPWSIGAGFLDVTSWKKMQHTKSNETFLHHLTELSPFRFSSEGIPKLRPILLTPQSNHLIVCLPHFITIPLAIGTHNYELQECKWLLTNKFWLLQVQGVMQTCPRCHASCGFFTNHHNYISLQIVGIHQSYPIIIVAVFKANM